MNVAVHRFEESIAGRPYLIEVANVSQYRWRAYAMRCPLYRTLHGAIALTSSFTLAPIGP